MKDLRAPVIKVNDTNNDENHKKLALGEKRQLNYK
jgi:hypothetical protein